MKKKWIWYLTDRKWISLWLIKKRKITKSNTERRANVEKKKIVAVVVALCIGCAVWVASQDFFFQDWKPKQIAQGQGYLQVTLVNPSPEGLIKSVQLAVLPDGSILSYWFWGEKGEAQFWKIGEEGYARDKEIEAGCVRCHAKTEI